MPFLMMENRERNSFGAAIRAIGLKHTHFYYPSRRTPQNRPRSATPLALKLLTKKQKS